jgi:hypothetical protein
VLRKIHDGPVLRRAFSALSDKIDHTQTPPLSLLEKTLAHLLVMPDCPEVSVFLGKLKALFKNTFEAASLELPPRLAPRCK